MIRFLNDILQSLRTDSLMCKSSKEQRVSVPRFANHGGDNPVSQSIIGRSAGGIFWCPHICLLESSILP